MPSFGPIGGFPIAGTPSTGPGTVPSGTLIFHGSNVTTNQSYAIAGHLLFLGATPNNVFAAPRVTWFGLEVLHPGVAQARVTWAGLEVLRSVASQPRVTWMGVEVLRSVAEPTRVTWMGVEVLRSVADKSVDSGWVSLVIG